MYWLLINLAILICCTVSTANWMELAANILTAKYIDSKIYLQANIWIAFLTANWNGHMELAPLVDAVPAERLTAPIGYRTSILTSTFTPSGIYKPFSHHYQGSIDFNTVNTTCSTGIYFLIHPPGWINDERMAVHCLKSGCIRLYIPPFGSVHIQ